MYQPRRKFIKSILAASTAPWLIVPKHALAYGDVLAITADGSNDPLPVLQTKTGLKISKVESFRLGGTVCMVRVETDDGSEGWGQASTYDADITQDILHRKVAHHFLNQDPADLGIIVDRCIEANYKFPWSYVNRALSGVDTAVWDLLGKREGKSVCELLGGKPKPFPVYGSSMSRSITPDDEADRLKKLADEFGYHAFKIRVGSVNGHDQDEWPGRTEAIIPTVRKALGDDITLLADANSCYTPPKAIEVGNLMQDHNYSIFEEPCPYWELEWTQTVTNVLSMDVSGGEQDNDLATWRRMIETRAVDIVQPDILYIGGVTRCLRVAKKAEQYGLTCVPHSANLAMVTLFSLHVMGAIPNAGRFVEYSIEDTPWAEELFEPGFAVVDGKVQIPEGPGWGVRVNPDLIKEAEHRVSEV